jgi:mannosyl-oligosaccharide alpha-1,2-mannosidase
MILRFRRLASLLTAVALVYFVWRWLTTPLDIGKQTSETSPKAGSGSSVINEQGVHKSGSHSEYSDETYGFRSDKLVTTLLNSVPQQSTTYYLPRVQHNFGSSRAAQDERLAAVKEAFIHSWNAYKKYAWLKDEVAPASGGYRTRFNGWAATLIDSLDTLWLMGLKTEFEEAVAAVEGIDFDTPDGLPINVFETTIRYLGGLLGAYDVSHGQYPALLKKAGEVGDMLLYSFRTPNRMPILRWHKISVEVAPADAVMSELGSLSLEFTRLSQLTGEPKYLDAVERITDCIYSQQMSTLVPGLLPTTVNARECDFSQGREFSLGARVDSAYEYMAKMHQLTAGRESRNIEMYARAMKPITQQLLFKPMTSTYTDILLAGTLKVYREGTQPEFQPQMQHLSCFAGGLIALGAKLLVWEYEVTVAERLTRGCIWASNITQTGIMPESFYVVPCTDPDDCPWNDDAWGAGMLQMNSFDEKPSDKQLPMGERLKLKAERLRMPKGMTAIGSREYKLRPEAIESVFVLYRITGDEIWREHAWTMFRAIVEQTRTEHAFSNIEDVTKNDSRKMDRMESYWIAETLKYFYLIFSSPDVVSLDEWVLNTEAHPFRLDHARR